MLDPQLSAEVAANLPYLRRYARALTGSQGSGDSYAVATMEAATADPISLAQAPTVKLGLFRTFHGIWATTGAPVAEDDGAAVQIELEGQARLQGLAANTREALLLRTIEGFPPADIAEIVGVSEAEAEELVNLAFADMTSMVSGSVMIIEDDAIIAMELETVVTGMGHRLTGVARTFDGALALADREVPDLILSDLQLADGTSGLDAVNALLASMGPRPVIFVTSFPERLLTGERPEPAFVIPKPYSTDQVRAAVSQAMFFSAAGGDG